jgi:hypothetical protein
MPTSLTAPPTILKERQMVPLIVTKLGLLQKNSSNDIVLIMKIPLVPWRKLLLSGLSSLSLSLGDGVYDS